MRWGLLLLLLFWNCNLLAARDTNIHIVGLNFPPYVIGGPGQPSSGIIVDIVSKALRELGYRPKFDITNWARAYAAIKNDQAGAIIPVMKSKDRETFLNFPEQPVMVMKMVLIGSRQHTIHFDGSLKSIQSHSIGRIHKARVSPKFDAARERGELNVEGRNSADLLIKAVAHQRLDLIALPTLGALWSAEKLSLENNISVLSPPLNQTPVYIAFSKKKVPEAITKKISKLLLHYHQDGTYKKTVSRYISPVGK